MKAKAYFEFYDTLQHSTGYSVVTAMANPSVCYLLVLTELYLAGYQIMRAFDWFNTDDSEQLRRNIS